MGTSVRLKVQITDCAWNGCFLKSSCSAALEMGFKSSSRSRETFTMRQIEIPPRLADEAHAQPADGVDELGVSCPRSRTCTRCPCRRSRNRPERVPWRRRPAAPRRRSAPLSWRAPSALRVAAIPVGHSAHRANCWGSRSPPVVALAQTTQVGGRPRAKHPIAPRDAFQASSTSPGRGGTLELSRIFLIRAPLGASPGPHRHSSGGPPRRRRSRPRSSCRRRGKGRPDAGSGNIASGCQDPLRPLIGAPVAR